MSFSHPFALVFFVAGLMVFGALAFGIAARRRTHVFWEYMTLIGATAIHTLAFALDLASESLELKEFFHRVAWIGFSTAAPAALLLALAFVRRRPRPPLVIGLFIPAVVFFALAWTNDAHHLLEGPAEIVEQWGYRFRVQSRGPLLGAFLLYANGCALTALGIYGSAWLNGPALQRRHARTLFFAHFVPWLLNVAFFVGSFPVRVTPLALGISTLVITWAFFRDGFLALVPVAHETVFATLREPIFVIDAEGRLLETNPAARALAPIATGARAGDALPFLAPDALASSPLDVVALGERRYERRAVPIAGGEGFVVTLHDVTTREAEAEATARALSARSDFIARMSHELRTPLQGILGSLELLERAGVDPSGRGHVDTAKSSARVLLALLDEVLDFERTGTSLSLDCADLDPYSLVHEAAAAVRSTCAIKGIALAIDDAGLSPELLEGDTRKIRQVLLNLVGNAVKFTDEGEVRLTARTERVGERRRLAFRIDDTGPGVPEESLSRVFEPFVQVERARTRRHEGIGLGLAICRRFADAMGAELTLENRSGGGLSARFSIELPLANPKEAARAVSIPPAVPMHLRVLLVDDHPVSREVVKALLESLGARVVAVGSGAGSLERARLERFDLALVDLHMPAMDGLETTRRIRALGTVPRVVIFTADERPSVNEECLAAGAAEVLRKPADASDLARVLRRAQSDSPKATARDARLVAVFAETYPKEIAALRRALDVGDHATCDDILHGLVGASALLGFTEVATLCREMKGRLTTDALERLEASCALAAAG